MRITGFEKIFKNPTFPFLPNLVLFLLFLGIVSRLYLVYILPIWHDEAASIWASQFPVLEILSGQVDPVHPPGYFLFLKLWSLFSDHLFWLRISSVFFFVINVYFLNKIGSKIKDSFFSLCLIFFYIFSGYFIIFDWQVRMYTGLTTLILASLFLLLNKNALLFTLINTVGLYFDYGFFWYFIPLLLFLCFQAFIRKNSYYRSFFFSAMISTSFFLIWLPSFLKSYEAGIEGIAWMKRYFSPSFSIPYFLGTHSNYLFFFPFLAITILGFLLFLRKQNAALQIVLFSAIFSFTSTMLYSVFFSPILHVRSLQIIGVAIVFLSASAMSWLYDKKQYYFILMIILLVLANFVFVGQTFFEKPGELLISFFPWKQLKNRIDKSDINYVVFRKTKVLPSDKLLWGLKYTLDGKESFPVKKIPYTDISLTPHPKLENCEPVPSRLLDIYGCK